MLRELINFKNNIQNVQNNLDITNKVINNLINDSNPILIASNLGPYTVSDRKEWYIAKLDPQEYNLVIIEAYLAGDPVTGSYPTESVALTVITPRFKGTVPKSMHFSHPYIAGNRVYGYTKLSWHDISGDIVLNTWTNPYLTLGINKIVAYKKVEKKVHDFQLISINIPSILKRRLFMLRVKGINIIDLNNIKENIGHKHTQTDITDRSCIFQDCVRNYTAAKSIKIPKYINYCVIKYTCFTPAGTSRVVTTPIMVVNYIGSLPPKSNIVLWGYVIGVSFTVDTSHKAYEENYNPKNELQSQNTLVYDGEDSNYCYYHIQGNLGNDNILFINAEKKSF